MITRKDTLPDWEFTGGETQEYEFTLRAENGGYYDIPGASAHLAIAEFVNPQATVLDVTGTLGKYNNYTCRVTFKLTPEDTVDLCGKYIYQITIKTKDGAVSVPQRGRMYIIQNIDKSFAVN